LRTVAAGGEVVEVDCRVAVDVNTPDVEWIVILSSRIHPHAVYRIQCTYMPKYSTGTETVLFKRSFRPLADVQ
jgi:hypothetical protein